jgi:hypothetical protein
MRTNSSRGASIVILFTPEKQQDTALYSLRSGKLSVKSWNISFEEVNVIIPDKLSTVRDEKETKEEGSLMIQEEEEELIINSNSSRDSWHSKRGHKRMLFFETSWGQEGISGLFPLRKKTTLIFFSLMLKTADIH